VKRTIISHDGIPLARGFEYQYYISRQGWQYLRYIDKPKNVGSPLFLEPSKVPFGQIVIDHLYQDQPESFAQYLAGAFDDKPFVDRGRHQRFPTTKYRELADALKVCRQELRQRELELVRLRTSNHVK
jgi:hypothetical protein